ncbi:MAG: hypothetical protein WCG31_01560, partial [Deltaproteobacteria bacterium]
MNNHESTNKIYNVVDPVKVTKKDYISGLVKKLYPDSCAIYIPFTVIKMMVFFQEKLFQAIGRRPFLTRYRLIASQRPILYDVSKIIDELAWAPPVSVEEAFDNLIEYEKARN